MQPCVKPSDASSFNVFSILMLSELGMINASRSVFTVCRRKSAKSLFTSLPRRQFRRDLTHNLSMQNYSDRFGRKSQRYFGNIYIFPTPQTNPV